MNSFHSFIRLLLPAAGALLCSCVSHAPPGDSVRVMTFNIHHAEGREEFVDLERVARVIRAARPDVICLQDVDRKTLRSEGVDQFEELGRLLGTRSGVFAKSQTFEQGETGVAVLSFWDMRRSSSWPLPGGNEPSVLLAVDLAHPTARRNLRIATTRFDSASSEVRLRQARSTLARLEEYERPVPGAPTRPPPMILAGDFSADPQSAEMKMLVATWRDTGAMARRPTFPAFSPDREWDYIFFRPPLQFQFRPREVGTEMDASTHRPVWVHLVWNTDWESAREE